jgi:predicted peptidase
MTTAHTFAITLAAVLAMPLAAHAADPLERFSAHTHKDGDFSLPYRLLEPAKIQPGEKYPLVIFLHGAGERGSDNEKQLVHGMKDFASDEISSKYPAFVIAPQCPPQMKWVEVDWSSHKSTMPVEPSQPLAATFALVDKLLAAKPIDKSRIYITGLSMGGYGTWDAIARRPELFAAAAPICGGGDPTTASRFKHLPLWAFHGDEDRAVLPERSREMIAALKAAGGDPQYTEYKGVGHNSWSQTYGDGAFYKWLFAQRKQSE